MSVITAITLDGILDYQFIHGTANGNDFGEFVERQLLPHLVPFNGRNSNSIVVMDDAFIHHCQALIASVGALLIIFLYTVQTSTQPKKSFYLLKHT